MERSIQLSSVLITIFIYVACLLCPPLRNKFKDTIFNMAINRQLPAGLFPVFGNLVIHNSQNEKLPIETIPIQLWRRMTGTTDFEELFLQSIVLQSHPGLEKSLIYRPEDFNKSFEEVAIKRDRYRMILMISFTFTAPDTLSELLCPAKEEKGLNQEPTAHEQEIAQEPVAVKNTPEWIPDFDICYGENARKKAEELGLFDSRMRSIIVINGHVVSFEFDGEIASNRYDILAEIVRGLHAYEGKVWTIENTILSGSKLRLERRDPEEFVFYIGDEKWISRYGMPSIPKTCEWIPKSGKMTIQSTEDPLALTLIQEMCKKSHATLSD
jgi:hypothetical protein